MRNVVMEGADPTGVRDNTDLLERLHRQAAKAVSLYIIPTESTAITVNIWIFPLALNSNPSAV